MKNYELYLDGKNVGTASIVEKSLYYHIDCKCRMPDAGMYRVKVYCNDVEADLGICIPLGECFGLQTRLPIKRLGKGQMSFQIISLNNNPGIFVPIVTEKEFLFLNKLKNAHFGYHGAMPGLWIEE